MDGLERLRQERDEAYNLRRLYEFDRQAQAIRRCPYKVGDSIEFLIIEERMLGQVFEYGWDGDALMLHVNVLGWSSPGWVRVKEVLRRLDRVTAATLDEALDYLVTE